MIFLGCINSRYENLLWTVLWGFRLLILFTYDLKVIFLFKELHEENPIL